MKFPFVRRSVYEHAVEQVLSWQKASEQSAAIAHGVRIDYNKLEDELIKCRQKLTDAEARWKSWQASTIKVSEERDALVVQIDNLNSQLAKAKARIQDLDRNNSNLVKERAVREHQEAHYREEVELQKAAREQACEELCAQVQSLKWQIADDEGRHGRQYGHARKHNRSLAAKVAVLSRELKKARRKAEDVEDLGIRLSNAYYDWTREIELHLNPESEGYHDLERIVKALTNQTSQPEEPKP